MALCFPIAHDSIDWSKGYTFLEQEFQSIGSVKQTGVRIVDQLIQVWKKTGEEQWVLVHLEIQAQPVKDFAERMFIYWYRIFDRYRQSIASVGVLVDGQKGWRPRFFSRGLWGCDLHYEYPIMKCLDYADKRAWLEESTNPFAIILLAQLTVLLDKRVEFRLVSKTALTRKFYERGWSKGDVLKMYYCLDALIKLPKPLELVYHEQVQAIEEEHRVAYITTAERFGVEKGLQQGLQMGETKLVKLLLEQKFKADSHHYLSQIDQADTDTLQRWATKILWADRIEAVFTD